MAQLGGAQREPSMEEILASIRRIIEDSDTVRRPEDSGQPVRPDNDVSPSPALASATSAPPQQSTVIEVDTFRSTPRAEVPQAETRQPVTLAEVQAQVVAERLAVRGASEPDYGQDFSTVTHAVDAAAANIEPAFEPAEASMTTVSPLPEIPTPADWQLGVSEPESVEAMEHDDFDLDAVANAVLEDIASSQANYVKAEDVVTDTPAVPVEAARPAIISDHTGRQVAAAFNELSEALAARNRKSLDEMAEEMLRPMLQDWLDNNLPTLVERLVREEIERVARGAN
ncbi:PopZ family protein [Mesorhizobium sp. ASY16-5R]|uniref:PopZ family protein n=1 Tax=Mesorhizobium sp. ASY16-5R TaxID=3445772 RepID=UPI003F9EF932